MAKAIDDRVCISGCCWCGTRYDHVEHRRDDDLLFPPRGFQPIETTAYARPCGHPVQGEIVKRTDGVIVVTMHPPWEPVPHMHPKRVELGSP